MICSTLTQNRTGKDNPCYTQIRLQKIRILEIKELHDGYLQCGLNVREKLVFVRVCHKSMMHPFSLRT